MFIGYIKVLKLYIGNTNYNTNTHNNTITIVILDLKVDQYNNIG